MSEASTRFEPGPRHYAAVYGLLLVLIIIGYLSFTTWSTATGALAVLSDQLMGEDFESQQARRTIIQFGTVVVGMILFLGLLSAEAYMRRGITGGRRQPDLVKRFLQVLLPMLAFLILGYLIRAFM